MMITATAMLASPPVTLAPSTRLVHEVRTGTRAPPAALAPFTRLVREVRTGTRVLSSGLPFVRSSVVCSTRTSSPRASMESESIETSPEAPDVTWSVLFYNDWLERYGSSEERKDQQAAAVATEAELNDTSQNAPDVAWPVFFYGDWLQKYGGSDMKKNENQVQT